MRLTKDYLTLSTLSNWFTYIMQRETRTRLRCTLRLLEYCYAISIIRRYVLIDIVKNLSSRLIHFFQALSNHYLVKRLVKQLRLRQALVSETSIKAAMIVVILPTSSGKSLLFLALACLKDLGVSVVVLPFRELLNNIKERLIAASIPHLEYNSAQSLLTLMPVSLSYSYATALLRA
ncbi:hypothetical protein HBI67_115490 [Parastagonospora nodorum]|nr:hypothetical protein HBI67_115490 [Parastagonospora nodorum]